MQLRLGRTDRSVAAAQPLSMSAFFAAAAFTSSGRTCGADGSLSATLSGSLTPGTDGRTKPCAKMPWPKSVMMKLSHSLPAFGFGPFLDQADAVRRGRGRLLRDDDRDRVAETVGVLRLEAVVLVGDPDRDLALDELRVRRGAEHAQHVARLLQLAEVVEPRLDVVHVAAGAEVRGERDHLADAGRARVEIDDRVLVLGLQQIGPRLRDVLDELGVDDERDGQRVDGEPLAVGIAEHRRQLVEVDGLERRDQILR